MSSLYKRSNGVYYVAFHDADRTPARKYVSTRFRTKRDAERVQREYETAYLHGEFDPWRDDPRTLRRSEEPPVQDDGPNLSTTGDAVAAFLASRANLSPWTIERYESICERFASHTGPERPVKAVTTADVQAFIDGTPTKPVTANNYRKALSTMFRWLEAENVRTGDPTKGVRLERVPQKHPRFLTRSDVDAVCRAIVAQEAKPHVEDGTGLWLLPIVQTNPYLGLRAGEVVNLRWQDVNLERGVLTVRCTDSFTTKAGKDRTIPLCAPVLEVLRDMERRSEFVFPNHSGTQLHRKYLSRRFKHFVRLAELPEYIHFHTTRHTAASWLAQQGASVEAIRLYMGHSSISVTQRYMHLSPDVYASQISAAFARVQA